MEDSRESNYIGEEKPDLDKGKKTRKKLITVLLVAVAVCILGGALVMAIGPKKVYHKLYQVTHSKASYYAWLETENAKGIFNSASQIGDSATHYEARITFGDLLRLKYSLPEQLTVKGNFTKNESIWYADAATEEDDQVQKKFQLMINSQTDQMLIGQSEEYYSVDAQDILVFLGERTKKSNIIFTYMKKMILNSGVKVTTDSSEKFTLVDKTITATKITAVFPKKQIYVSLAEQLEKMESDEVLLSSLNVDDSNKERIISALKQAVDLLQEESNTIPEEETTEVVCYVDSNGVILGRVFHIPIGILDIQLSYMIDTTGGLIVTADINKTNVMSLQIIVSKADNMIIPEIKDEDIKGNLNYSKLLPFLLQQESLEDEVIDGGFEFTLGQYKGVKVSKETPKVTEEELKEVIQQFVEYDAKMLPTNRTMVADGDLINIDYTGTIDGEEFEGSKGSDVELIIGSNQFVEGFEPQLIGANVEKPVTFHVTFPKDYKNTELAGKEAVFHVTVNAIGTREYTDEFIVYNTDYTTRKEYEEAMYNQLFEEKTKQCEQDVKDTLMETIVANCNFTKVNQGEIDDHKQQMLDTYQYYASLYQVGLEEFVSSSFQLTMDEFNEAIGYYADLYIKETYVVKEIARQEGIEITEDEYNEQLPNYMKQYECDSVEDFEKAFGGKEGAKEALLQEKILDFLIEHADIETQQ